MEWDDLCRGRSTGPVPGHIPEVGILSLFEVLTCTVTSDRHQDLNYPCRRCRGTRGLGRSYHLPKVICLGRVHSGLWLGSLCPRSSLPLPQTSACSRALERPQDPGRGRLRSRCTLTPHLSTPTAQLFDPSFLPWQALLSLKRGLLFPAWL